MKIDLNFNLKGLDGKDIAEANAGKILGNSLVSQSKGDAVKYYYWAVKLYNGESIEVDKSDLNKIKEFVKESTLPILTKAQILDSLPTE